MKESSVERVLTASVRTLGGMTAKLTSPAGVPDRLVLLPGLEPILVEVKTDVGRLRPAQVLWHAAAAARGYKVHVVSGTVGVATFMEEIMSDRIARAAGRLSAARRWKGSDGAPDETEARAELAEAKLERAITQAQGELTPDGRKRLSALLDDGDVL